MKHLQTKDWEKRFDEMWNNWSGYFILKGKGDPVSLSEGVKQFISEELNRARDEGYHEAIKKTDKMITELIESR